MSNPQTERITAKPGKKQSLKEFIAWPTLCLALVCLVLTGCSFLKPAQYTARHFILTPVVSAPGAAAATHSISIGLGRVKVPGYLLGSSIVVRMGTNEVEYLPSSLWAERLDTGFQRVLAADLGLALPSDQVHVTTWESSNVAAEVYVGVERFDVEVSGRGVLVARWRVLAPGEDKVLKAGTSRVTREGPKPGAGASGVVETLSELIAEFSKELAAEIRDIKPATTR